MSPNHITISINASTPGDLTRMVQELAAAMGGNTANVVVGTTDGESSAAFVVETGKRPRGRKKEADNGASGVDGAGPALVAEGNDGRAGPCQLHGVESDAALGSAGPSANAGGVSAVGARGSGGGRDDGHIRTAGSDGDAEVVGRGGAVEQGGAAGGGEGSGPGVAANGAAASEGVVPPAAHAAPAAQANNVVTDLTQQDALDKGIAELQQYFAADATNMQHISKLQSKYGVKLFKEIALDRAHEFYADVKLLMSGTPVA